MKLTGLLAAVLLALTTLSTTTTTASSSSHAKDSGSAHAYKLYGNEGATVKLTLVIDLLCPYSAEAFTPIHQLITDKTYKADELYLTAHIHSLPYHRNSYLLAKGATVVRDHNNSRSAITDYIQGIFDNQDSFNPNSAVTTTAVLRQLAQSTCKYGVYGSTDVSICIEHFQHGFSESSVEEETRAKWKHIVRRGWDSTPIFTIQGKEYEEADSSWDYKKWKSVLDELIKNDGKLSAVEAVEQYDGEAMYLADSVDDSSDASTHHSHSKRDSALDESLYHKNVVLSVILLSLVILSVFAYRYYKRYTRKSANSPTVMYASSGQVANGQSYQSTA